MLKLSLLRLDTTREQKLPSIPCCLLWVRRSRCMSIPSEAVKVLQEGPATLALSPILSTLPGPLAATGQQPRGTRVGLGEAMGSVVCGLSTAPCRGNWEGHALEEGGGSRSGGWRVSRQPQRRTHARMVLRHAKEITRTQAPKTHTTMSHNTTTNMIMKKKGV